MYNAMFQKDPKLLKEQLREDNSGVRKELPANVKKKVETYFGCNVSNVKIRESENIYDTFGVPALAKGDTICFQKGMFQPNSPLGQQMIGHEFSHIVQQQQGEVNSNERGINTDSELENSANIDGNAIASMPEDCAISTHENLPSISNNTSDSSPIQGWNIGGTSVQLKNFVSGHTEANGVSNINEGVHEMLTRKAFEKAREALGNERENYSKNIKKRINSLSKNKVKDSLRFGSRWNDIYNYDNISFAMHYTMKDSSFINQSHCGDMQFLHSMDCSNGKLAENTSKMRRWANFANDVYQGGREFQKQSLLDYVLSRKDETYDGEPDPLLEMLGSVLVSKDKLHKIEEESREEAGDDTQKYSRLRLRKIKKHLFAMNKIRSNLKGIKEFSGEACSDLIFKNVHKVKDNGIRQLLLRNELRKGVSEHATQSIGEFFTGGNTELDAGLVALGSAAHMLEDSFAGSHTIREYNTHQEANLQVGKGQDSNIISQLTPIMINADYTKQDSSYHAYADQLLLGKYEDDYSDDDKRDADILATKGASFARDVAAQFMYNAVTNSSHMKEFLKGVTKVSDRSGNRKITSCGRQYCKLPKEEYSIQAQELLSGWGKQQISTIGYSKNCSIEERINKNMENLTFLQEKIQSVFSHLDPNEKEGIVSYFVPQLNEIEIEMESIQSQLVNNDILPNAISDVLSKVRDIRHSLNIPVAPVSGENLEGEALKEVAPVSGENLGVEGSKEVAPVQKSKASLVPIVPKNKGNLKNKEELCKKYGKVLPMIHGNRLSKGKSDEESDSIPDEGISASIMYKKINGRDCSVFRMPSEALNLNIPNDEKKGRNVPK